jgi:hypothetical protein
MTQPAASPPAILNLTRTGSPPVNDYQAVEKLVFTTAHSQSLILLLV